MSDSGAPAATSAADTASVRGVALGCANVAVSMTMPAMSAAASVPSPASSGTPRRAASSATISHVAAEPGSIQSASPPSLFEAWWSMITRGSVENSSGCRWATAPTRSADPQSHEDEQVVRLGGIGVGPEPLDAGEERSRAAAPGPCRRRRPGAERLEHHAHADDRAERVGVGVLVAHHERVPGVGQAREDRRRDGVAREGRQVDRAGGGGHLCFFVCFFGGRCGVSGGAPRPARGPPGPRR